MTSRCTLDTAGPLLEMQQRMQGRLKAYFPERQFGHAIVPARMSPETWARLTQRTPFVGLGWRGFQPDQNTGRLLHATAQWTVFLVAKNSAGVMQRMTGDQHGPGLLGMVQVACAALHGWTMVDIGTAMVDGAANLQAEGFNDEAAAIAGVNIRVNFALADARVLEDFLTLGVAWEFEPLDAAPGDTVAGPDDTYEVRPAA